MNTYTTSSAELQLFTAIPEGLDLEDIVGKRLAEPSMVVIDRLYTDCNIFRRYDQDETVWTPLHQKQMALLYGKGGNWSKAIQQLIQHSVVRRGNHYTVGIHSFPYTLLDEWVYRDVQIHQLTRQRIIDRFAEIERANDRAGLTHQVHFYLRDWNRELTVDREVMRQVVDGDPCRTKKRARIALGLIEAGRFRFKVCRYGRFHTNITSLWSPARTALRIQGKPLVGLDISNSQPLLQCLITALVHLGVWTVEDVLAMGTTNELEHIRPTRQQQQAEPGTHMTPHMTPHHTKTQATASLSLM